MRRSGAWFLCVASLMALVLSLSGAEAAGEKPEEFMAGMRALELGELAKSAGLLQAALDKQGEDGELTRLYGTRFASYLPQFYLGLAFYKQGNCTKAMKEWKASSSHGAVLKTKEYEVLLQLLPECERRLSEKELE